jgi:hypothetical protein
MPGSIRIGKIVGIEISIHVSWLLIVVLLTWSLATGWLPSLYQGWSTPTYWVVSLLATLLLPHGWHSAFVMQGEYLAGLITLSDIRHVPREEWAQTPVGFAMTPLERLHGRGSAAKLERGLAAHGRPGCEPGVHRGGWPPGRRGEPRGHRALPGNQARTWPGRGEQVSFCEESDRLS